MVIALFGPTGVGKTAVAVSVATRLEVRVLSCDSMQIYRGFPILTNQPSAAERAAAPHLFVGVANSAEEWSAAQYGDKARAAISEDLARHRRALVTGGTGLWMRAALAPLAIPQVHDSALRERLRRRAAEEGPAALHAELAALDPQAATRIHPANGPRVVRALEVTLSLGAGAWADRADLWDPEYDHPTLLVGLTVERAELKGRIDRRTSHMLAQGAVEEVRRDREDRASRPGTAAAGARRTGPAGVRGVARAIGYQEIAGYLEGRLPLDEVASCMATATRHYARRQLTWMRRLKDAVIIDASGRDPDDVAAQIVQLAADKEQAD